MFAWLVVLPVCGALLLYVYYRNALRYWQRRGVAAPPASAPFGNIRRVLFRCASVNDLVCDTYARMKAQGHAFAGLYFFSRAVFLPIEARLVRRILAQDFEHFHDRGIHHDAAGDPMSAHLFALSGPRWRRLRAQLTPAFTAGRTRFMFPAMRQCGDELVELLAAAVGRDAHVEVKDVVARFATDVIGSCAFGLECRSLRHPDAEFRAMGRRAFTQTPRDALRMVLIRSFPRLARRLGLSVFAPSVSAFFRRVVHDTVAYRERHGVERADFLHLLVQMKLSADEIAAQAFIFFLAGFETTSATISFALLEMALAAGVQGRARAELRRVLRQHDGELTFDALGQLPYLESVVLESLRKYPPAPVFLRKCTEAYRVPGTNVCIEKGLSVLIPAMALHRDPDFFPQPERFEPDRFSAENRHRIREHVYLPFGDGPRICIGMRFAMVQAKLALALFLRHYEFVMSERTQLPLEMEKKGIVLSPIGGIWLRFTRLQGRE